MASISPFNILLNNLSSDLSKLNLHNLVNHVESLSVRLNARESHQAGMYLISLFDETQEEKSQGG